jgi:hypothetical protein
VEYSPIFILIVGNIPHNIVKPTKQCYGFE